MDGSKVFVSFFCVQIIVLQLCVGVDLLMEPDFVSNWYDMIAQAGTNTTLLSVAHGLGDTPLLVDVQVMVTSGDNKGYIFPGSDDDEPEGYGGIIYIYNHIDIKISSPIQANEHLGRCVYTGKSPYWEGPYSTDSYTAKVRARAWKNSSLPPADLIKTGIFISTGDLGSQNYFEIDHDLGQYYPALVISRTRFPSNLETYPNYYSDSIGSSMGMYDNTYTQNSFVVYGFNNKTIRIWASHAETDYIFAGTDGWNFNSVKNGTLELYAWTYSSLPPTLTAAFRLGRKRKSDELQQTALFKNNGHMFFVRAWVQATSGVNAGFRFIGNGNLAYDEVKTADVCSYGGLLYAYNNHSIRFWQPGPGNGTSNGALICIASGMGGGVNVQASTEGVAVYYSWDLEAKASTSEFPSTTIMTQSTLTSTNSTTSHSYSTPSTTKSSLISPNVSSTSISHSDASPTFSSSSSSFPTSPYKTSSFHSSSSPATTISKTSEFPETTNTFTHTTTTPTMTTSSAKNTISSLLTYKTGSSSSTISTTSESTDNTTSTHPTMNSSPKSSTINTASSVSTENYTTSTKHSSTETSINVSSLSASTEESTTSTHLTTDISTEISTTDLSTSTEKPTTSTELITDVSTETATTYFESSVSTEKSTTSTQLTIDISTETSAVDSSTSVSTEKSTTLTPQTTDISKDYSTVTAIASASTCTSTITSKPTSTVTTESTTTSTISTGKSTTSTHPTTTTTIAWTTMSTTSPVSIETSTTSTNQTTTTAIASSTVSNSSPVSIETSTTSTNQTTTTTIASSTVSTTLPVSIDTSTTSTQPTTTTTIAPTTTSTTSPVSTEISTTQTHPTTTTTTESSTMSTTSLESTTESPSTVSATEGATTTTTLPNISTSTPLSTTSNLVNCGNPPDIEFGQIEKNGTTPGSVATYYCRPGYNISGNNSAVCETNGNWTELETKCLPVDCGLLYLAINNSEEIKYIPKTSTVYGSVALLQCKYGFSLSKENKSVTFICSENGYWTGNTSVKCTPVSCSRPEVPANAVLSYSKTSFSVGSVVRYNCSNDYLLEGRSTRACQSSGNWSGSVPSCKKAPQKPINPCEAALDNRGLLWNKTIPGQISMIQCSIYDPKQNLSGEITRECSTEGKWLLPRYNCIRKELEEITEAVNIIKENPTAEVVSDVLGQLSTFTTKTDSNSTYSGELEAVTSTLEAIASIDYSKIKLTENQTTSFFETTSNLLDTSNAESWQAIDDQPSSPSEKAPSGASKVLDVISRYTDTVSNSLNSTGGNISVSFDNLLLEIRSLQDSVDIVFPHIDQNSSSSLGLPKASLNGSATYSAVLYKNLTGVMSINASFHGNDIKLGSSVMSVKLDNWKKVDNFKITFSFQHFERDKDLKTTCSYRNESGVLWGRDGCAIKHTNTTISICECDHLTNFAILMSPWTEDNVETEAIRIVSIVGCSISIVCLIITILTHMCYWKYVKSDRVKILMNLCVALLISYCIFLGGVDRTSNKDVCTTVAVFLQYIYLVVFFLMLAEGVEISFVVLYVFTTKSRLKWILPSAWLLPALIVGISLAVTQTKGYGNDKSCWLSVGDGLIWAFVGPALLIILINFILIVLVLKAVFRTKNLSQKSLRERTIVGVRCLCVLLPLVGCTWVLGIFYVNEDMAWIQYVFAVCNGLQGFAIFLFHCALNTQIKHAFERRRKSSSAAMFTRSTSNPILIPRAKPSSSTSDLYQSINNSFGVETTFHRNRNVRERYQAVETLEMPRAKPSSSTSDLYQSINNSFGVETTFHRNRNVRERYQAVETLEMKRFPDTGYQYDKW